MGNDASKVTVDVCRGSLVRAKVGVRRGTEAILLHTQSWVNREYRRGLSQHPCGAPVLRISEEEIMFPTFTTWGRPIRKSRTQGGLQTQGPELNDELGGYYVKLHASCHFPF